MSFKGSKDFINIKYQAEVVKAIRSFFDHQGFQELIPPLAVENPGMETHIHPFQLYSVHGSKARPHYLSTSPEFWMKKALSDHPELKNIYTVNYSFRDEPSSSHHRFQFLMLEWYRSYQHYEVLIDDLINLTDHLCEQFKRNKPKMTIKTISEIFNEFNIPIDELESKDSMREFISTKHPEIPLPAYDQMHWDDYYFLLFLNLIEPQLHKYPFLILKEYPAPLAALSTLKKDNPKVCERLELYLDGVEVANAYNELTDLVEQKNRFQFQASQKQNLYGYELPEPKTFYQALGKGLPSSCGIALGVDRLAQYLSRNQYHFYY